MSGDSDDSLVMWVRDTQDYLEYLAILGVDDLPVVAGPGNFQAPAPRTRAPGVSPAGAGSSPAPSARTGVGSGLRPSFPSPPPAASPPPLSSPPSLGPTWKRTQAAEPPVTLPASLDELRKQMGDCRLCTLCDTRHTLSFGAGGAPAQVVLVGDVPEREWDQNGQPWGGPVGQMLQRIVENVLKISTSQAYLTSVVKCRPSEGKLPSPLEIDTCAPFLRGQARLSGSYVVVALGELAGSAMIGRPATITELRAQWWTWEGMALRVTHHPREVLADRELRRAVMDDMVLVRERMDQR